MRAVYREDGKRAWKQVSSGNRFLFLYDGDQIVCGFNANGDLSRINVWGAHGLIGRQSGTNMGTMVYDYVWDNRGNISQVLNPNGAVAYNFRVTSWGEVASDVPAGSANDPYRCLGGELGNYLDVETGLVLCGQRYYDPSGGRWLNRDPISYDGGMNVYAYVANNPVNEVDPEGLAPVGWTDGNGGVYYGKPRTGGGGSSGSRTRPQISEREMQRMIDSMPMGGGMAKAVGQVGRKVLPKVIAGLKNRFWKKPCPEYKYHPRIRQRAVQDPKHHNFPYSFDKVILATKPVRQTDGSLLYRTCLQLFRPVVAR